jgi:hypothetical protein
VDASADETSKPFAESRFIYPLLAVYGGDYRNDYAAWFGVLHRDTFSLSLNPA